MLKALDFAVTTALQSAHSSIPEYLRNPDACSGPSHQAAVRLREAQEVVQAAATSAKEGKQEARACERDLGVWQRRHARCVAQAEKWGSAGDGAVQMAFAATEEALAQGRSAVHAIEWSSSVRHRVTHVKEAVQAEEALLLAERKRQEEAHLDVQRALLALPDLTRRAAMVDASVRLWCFVDVHIIIGRRSCFRDKPFVFHVLSFHYFQLLSMVPEGSRLLHIIPSISTSFSPSISPPPLSGAPPHTT